MSTPALKVLISEEQEGKPVICISRVFGFLAGSLARALLSQNCIVIAISDWEDTENSDVFAFPANQDFHLLNIKEVLENKELSKKIQYFFVFVENADDYKKISPLVNSSETHQAKKIFLKEGEVDQTAQVLENIVRELSDAAGIYLSNVYGPGMNKENPVIADVLKMKGQEKEFSPLFITDAVHVVSKIMFGRIPAGQIYYVSGSKENPNLGWKPKITPNEGIGKLEEWLSSTEKIPEQKEKVIIPQSGQIEDLFSKSTAEIFDNKITTRTENQEQSAKPRAKPLIPLLPKITKVKIYLPEPICLIFICIILALLIIGTPLLAGSVSLSRGADQLKKSKDLFEEGKFNEAKKNAQNAEKNFIHAQKTSENLDSFPKPRSFQKILGQTKQKSQVAIFLARSIQRSADAYKPAEELLKNIKGDSKTDISQKTLETKEELFEVDQNLAQAEAVIKENISFEQTEYSLDNLEEIHRTRRLINFIAEILGFFPMLVAQNGRKTYLILFQNNMELRPTGGFIGSLATVTLEAGQLFDVNVEDSFTLDSQLKGRVWPPAPISKYLGQQNWYLRDANWNPDFTASAQKIEWFFTKETGKQIDGVVALDNTAIQYILKEMGPLEIPEFKEIIDSKNILEKIQSHAEINLFDGSFPQRDFLGIVGGHLWEKILTLPTHQWPRLIGAMLQGLEEKHMQIFIHDQFLQETVVREGWSGAVRATACKETNCVSDYLLLVDSNLGANRANHYLKRKLQKELSIEKDGQIFSEAIITLENNSPTNIWPGGIYKTYLRAVVPKESKLLQLKIDGKIASFSAHIEGGPSTSKPGEVEVDIATESATPLIAATKTSFGFFLEVPIKTSRVVSLLYKLPQKLNFTQPQSRYELLFQKQAGTGYDPATITIAFPQFLKIEKSTPETVTQDQLIKYSTDLSIDREFFVEFDNR